MIDALFCQPSYLATKKLLDATALRQAALASNLANLETPQYKRIDLAPSFREEFERAVHAGNGKAINQIAPALAVDNKTRSANRDGNTVETTGAVQSTMFFETIPQCGRTRIGG